MSVESRPALRGLRRANKEPDRPDYSEPDFTSWAAKLDDFAPIKSAPAAAAVAEAPEAPAAPTLAAGPVAPTPVPDASEGKPGLDKVLEGLLSFDGALSVALVDSETGMTLGSAGSGADIELAAAGASQILRARLASVAAFGGDEKIDDVLISLTSQVQIIHPLPQAPSVFTFLIGDRAKSSLAMARYKAAEADLLIQL